MFSLSFSLYFFLPNTFFSLNRLILCISKHSLPTLIIKFQCIQPNPISNFRLHCGQNHYSFINYSTSSFFLHILPILIFPPPPPPPFFSPPSHFLVLFSTHHPYPNTSKQKPVVIRPSSPPPPPPPIFLSLKFCSLASITPPPPLSPDGTYEWKYPHTPPSAALETLSCLVCVLIRRVKTLSCPEGVGGSVFIRPYPHRPPLHLFLYKQECQYASEK